MARPGEICGNRSGRKGYAVRVVSDSQNIPFPI